MAHPKDSIIPISSSPELPSIDELDFRRKTINSAPIPEIPIDAFNSATDAWKSGRLDAKDGLNDKTVPWKRISKDENMRFLIKNNIVTKNTCRGVAATELTGWFDTVPALKTESTTKSKPAKKTAEPHKIIQNDLPSSLVSARDRISPTLASSMIDITAKEVFQDLTDVATFNIVGKRSRVQMVATTDKVNAIPLETMKETVPPDKALGKSKALEKTTRTITELAMAKYRMKNEIDTFTGSEAPLGSLLDYFTVHQNKHPIKRDGPKAELSKKGPRTKAAKKAGLSKPVVLSPASAQRQLSQQDFVFGTASQLGSEESPALLRAIHNTMVMTNKDEDSFHKTIPSTRSTLVSRGGGLDCLWAAGARDEDGGLLYTEVIDLLDSPSVFKTDSFLDIPTSLSSPIELVEAKEVTDSTAISATQSKSIVISSSQGDDDPLESPRTVAPLFSKEPQGFLNTHSGIELRQKEAAVLGIISPEPDSEPPASNQEHYQIMSQSQVNTAARKPRPNYELLSNTQLAKQVQSYGFKPIKRRTAMISLLDQCWASRNHQALEKAAISQSPKLGRPKRATSTRTADSSLQMLRKRGRLRRDKLPPPGTPPKTRLSLAKSDGQDKDDTKSFPLKNPADKMLEIADSNDEDEDSIAPSPTSFALSPSDSQRASSDRVNTYAAAAMDTDLSMLGLGEQDEQEEEITMTTPLTRQAQLFRLVARAVLTAPRSRDLKTPSWHERMLMYDPVVVEDLAAWLNSGQLDRVGYDGEVSAEEVKNWCEQRSVCCMYRANTRGLERKRS